MVEKGLGVITKSYKIQKDMENHDSQYSDGTLQIDVEEYPIKGMNMLISSVQLSDCII